MSSNFVRFQKIPNQAFAKNFTCLSKKLVNPLFYLSPYFLFHIPFLKNSLNSDKILQKFRPENSDGFGIHSEFFKMRNNTFYWNQRR